MATTSPTHVGDRCLALHPQVALRREPFGALAYHYDTRRLVLLKHPDIVTVIEAFTAGVTVDETLDACNIAPARHRAFHTALQSLVESNMLT